MKKLISLFVISAFLFTLVPLPMAMAGNDNVHTLYAGQNIPVGTVTVTNNADYLYVLYELDGDAIDEGWCITETHVHVGEEDKKLADFPLNRGGNPQIGHFAYKEKHDCVPEYTETVPLGDWEADNDLLIAAHAVIEKEECKITSGEITPELSWSRSSETDVDNFSGYGAQWDPLTEGFTIPTPLTDEDEVWDGGKAGQYFMNYSTRDDISWASWEYAASDPRGGNFTGSSDLRRFNATFILGEDIADNITLAILRMPDFAPDAIPINDNVYIFLNEILQFWGGTRVEGAAGNLTIFEGISGVPAIATYLEGPGWGGLDFTGWYIPGEFPDLYIANFVTGENNLDVFTEENETGGGMAKLELVLEYEYQECITYDQTAWAAGTRFTERGNWATYFKYTVMEEELEICSIEEYTLRVDSLNGNAGFTHKFVIYYNLDLDLIYGTGDSPHAGTQTLSEFSYTIPDGVIRYIKFRSDYDTTSYYWFPAFYLNENGTLTYDNVGGDNVHSATGSWESRCAYNFLETVYVPSENTIGVITANILEADQPYLLKVSGTFTYNNAGDWADAEWYFKGGVIVKGDTEGSVPHVLDVSIRDYPTDTDPNMDWGDFNPDHIYQYEFMGRGSTENFYIHDSHYPDNNGSIRVDIYMIN